MKSRSLIMSVVLILAGSSTQALAKADTAFLTEAIQINLAEISVKLIKRGRQMNAWEPTQPIDVSFAGLGQTRL